jgi:hypothetical protein
VGNATLGGTFKEVLTSGYIPVSGDGGKVLKWGTSTGSFASVMINQALTAGLTSQTIYGGHALRILVS